MEPVLESSVRIYLELTGISKTDLAKTYVPFGCETNADFGLGEEPINQPKANVNDENIRISNSKGQ